MLNSLVRRPCLHIQTLDTWTNPLYNARPFVAEAHVNLKVVFIGSAKTTVSDPDQHRIISQRASMSDSFDDASAWRAFVDGEADVLRGRVHDEGFTLKGVSFRYKEHKDDILQWIGI